MLSRSQNWKKARTFCIGVKSRTMQQHNNPRVLRHTLSWEAWSRNPDCSAKTKSLNFRVKRTTRLVFVYFNVKQMCCFFLFLTILAKKFKLKVNNIIQLYFVCQPHFLKRFKNFDWWCSEWLNKNTKYFIPSSKKKN